jgi:type IV pilus assembly protein PilA
MRIGPRSTRAAFTLIELMIVVAIIGILSVLAAYGVRKYIANAKTAEARNGIGRLAAAAMVAYEHEHMATPVLTVGSSTAIIRSMCRSASTSVPGSVGVVAGRKYQSSMADWNADSIGGSGFACLHFTIDQPQYYMYSYVTSGTSSPGDTFTAMANGDLNGDGMISTFQLSGSINASYVINVAPNIIETSPEE